VKPARVITNTVCYLALMLTSAKAGEGWQSMDLSKDPTSLSTILALLRNHERFAKWINGKPLGKFTYVSLRKDRNDPSKTVYVLLECDENKKPVRFLRVDEIAKLRVTDSKVPETAELTFEYPAAAVKATSLDHPSVQRAVEQMLQLFRSAQSTLYLVDDHYVERPTESERASATLTKLSDQGLLVIRLVSKAADKVSNAFNAISKSKSLAWDSTSIKRIRFELSPDRSTIRALEIVGLFKTDDIKLQSPDAANLSKLEIKDDRTTEVAVTEMTARGVREKGGEKEQSPSPVNWDTKD
jgi:vacuolar-type H+-ATPase subunit I/STV1